MKRLHLGLGAAVAAGITLGILSEGGSLRTSLSLHKVQHAERDQVGNLSASIAEARSESMGAALTALTGPLDLQGLVRLGSVLPQLGKSDLRELLDSLERNGGDSPSPQLTWLFAWMLTHHKDVATEWITPRLVALAQDGPRGTLHPSDGLGKMIVLWAQANPDGAITFARGYPSLGISEQLITSAALKICAQERSRGLAVLLDFPAGRARTGALKSLFADWAKREPSAAFASASQIETGEARDQSMGAVLTTWAATDASAALEGYQAAGINDATVLANVLTGLVEKNPATVVAVLENLPPYDFQRCGSRVLGAWARHDPATALTWAFERGLSLGGTMEVESSIEHLSLRRIYTTKEWNIESPLSTAFASKPDATLAWLESLPAGADRDEVYELAIGASRDAGAVLELFSQMQPDAAARAAFKIGSRFAADPHVSKRWIESLPPGRVRQQAFAGFGLSGYGDEPARLDDRDAWLSGRSQMMNWQAGLKETAKISDPSLRRDMFEVFFQKHFPYFRGTSEERNEAVNKVMEDAGLSEEAKRRLLD